jgi:hypothetical protein
LFTCSDEPKSGDCYRATAGPKSQERKRANRQAEIAQGDVVVRAQHQQIQDDPGLKVYRNEIRDRQSQVLFPVRQKTEELVRTRNDRRDDEPDIECQIGLKAFTLTTVEPGRMAPGDLSGRSYRSISLPLFV